MKRSLAAGVTLLIALASPTRAHQLDEYVQASKISVGKDRVTVELRLTPGLKVLSRVLAVIDPNGDGVISPDEQRAYAERVRGDLTLTLDGTRLPLRLVALGFPDIDEMQEGLGEIRLDFDAIVPAGASARRLTFENHHQSDIAVYLANALIPQDTDVRITGQRRSYEQASFTLDYVQSGMVRLGMRHIAEGTDHLLFLLVLLLPAPLAAVAGRWKRYDGARRGAARLLRIVTAFTIGHSITLAAAATGRVHAPSAVVEVLVALSILVSAVHAVRPIFPGREALVAGGFGLVHGLAFATTIAGYRLDPWHTVLTVLGFNLGIELMQLTILVLTVPWLFSLARTPAYGTLRDGGAVAAGIAALGWIGERAFGLANPIAPLVDGAAGRGPWLVVALALLAFVSDRRVRLVSRVLPSAMRRV
jgi:hypothetical protein